MKRSVITYGEDDKFTHIERNLFIDKTLGLVGLNNLGNTCFLNSTLQSLMHIDIFRHNFLALMKMEDTVAQQSPLSDRGSEPATPADPLSYEFYALIRETRLARQVVSPRNFYKVFSKLQNGLLGGFRQHDAEEAYTCILDTMHNELIQKDVKIVFESDDNSIFEYIDKRKNINSKNKMRQLEEKYPNTKIKHDAFMAIKNYYKKNYSIITQFFNGFFISSLECQECGYVSNQLNSFLILNVEWKANDLLNNLENMCAKELLTGDEKWKCTHCEEYCDTHKRLQIWALPIILTIQLKRYSNNSQKINSFMQIPFEINMIECVHPLSINDIKKYTYQLISVINHSSSSISSGHYTTNCLINNQWYCFDDSHVTKLSVNNVITSEAYLLIYIRSDYSHRTAIS